MINNMHEAIIEMYFTNSMRSYDEKFYILNHVARNTTLYRYYFNTFQFFVFNFKINFSENKFFGHIFVVSKKKKTYKTI